MNDTTQPNQTPSRAVQSLPGGKDVVVAQSTKELTKDDVFQPTPHMRVWLDTAIQLETDSITDIAEASKITRQSWYEWLDKPGFIEWFRAEWDRKLSGSAWKLDAIGLKRAKGDFKYWEGMQKRVGNIKDENSGININGEKVIAILGGATHVSSNNGNK